MTGDLAASKDESTTVYRVGLNATRLLFALGDVFVGWLLLRSAHIALTALAEPQAPSDISFYEGKVAAAQFFAREVLPKIAAEREIAETVGDFVMELDEAAF